MIFHYMPHNLEFLIFFRKPSKSNRFFLAKGDYINEDLSKHNLIAKKHEQFVVQEKNFLNLK